ADCWRASRSRPKLSGSIARCAPGKTTCISLLTITQDKLQRKEAIRKELDEVTSTFHCELCNKRYKKVTEYDAHLGSYDHGHTKVRPFFDAFLRVSLRFILTFCLSRG